MFEIPFHCFGELIDVAFFVAEVKAGFGCTSRIAVSPKGVEVGVCIDGASGIGVVAGAVLRELYDALPRLSTAFPHRHFSAGIVGLWSGFCGGDDAPGAICFEVEGSHVVVAVGCGDGVGVPVAPSPLQQGPGARVIFRSRFITFAGDDEDDGISLWVEANVFEIDF